MDEGKHTTTETLLYESCKAPEEKTGTACLEAIRALTNEQNWLRQKLDLLRQASTDTSVKITSAPGHTKEDKLCTLVAQIDATERQLEETEARRQELIQELMQQLDGLKSQRMRTIVFMHCVLGMPYSKVSEALDLSYSVVTKHYRKAIRLLEGSGADKERREPKQRLSMRRSPAPPRRSIPAR